MKNNTQATENTSSTIGWDTSDIFAANFMFPSKHFEDSSKLEALTDEEFSKLSIDLLTPIQPLTNNERSELAKSVKSGNRLRTYYQIMKIIDLHAQVVNETSTLGCEDAKLSDNYDHVKMKTVEGLHLVVDDSDPV